jgi:hypothetical protein
MTENIEQIAKRTQRYYFEDGFWEICIGVLYLLIAGVVGLWTILPKDSPWMLVVTLGLPVLILAGSGAIKGVLNTFKQRITYPRTGYVTFSRRSAARGNWVTLGIGFLGALVIVFTNRWVGRITVIEGLVLAIGYIVAGWRMGLVRFYLVALLTLIAGLVAAWLGLQDSSGIAAIFSVMGTATLICGLVTLRDYLRQNPAPIGGDDEQ